MAARMGTGMARDRILILLLGMLIGCGEAQPPPPPQLDQRLRNLFAASCASCHMSADSHAPQLDDAIWDQKWAQGFDVLMKRTIEGSGGMPPLGGCSACSYEDLAILVQYLAGRSKEE